MLDVLADTYRIATRTEAFEAPRPAPTRRPLPHRPVQRTPWLWRALGWIGGRLRAWRDRARTREVVLRMSERQLQDIGATRDELLRALDER